MMQKSWKMTETLANGYSYESTQRELSNEYQHDRVWMVFKDICVLVLEMKVASALEGLKLLHSWLILSLYLCNSYPGSKSVQSFIEDKFTGVSNCHIVTTVWDGCVTACDTQITQIHFGTFLWSMDSQAFQIISVCLIFCYIFHRNMWSLNNLSIIDPNLCILN